MDFKDFVSKANWHWATTYADKAPHWYCVRAEFADDDTFDKMVMHIRENGRIEKFFRKAFTYYYDGNYKYWTMGNPVNETRIINRAKI